MINKDISSNNYTNFWSYIANAVKNGIISILRKKKNDSLEYLTYDIIDINSPESDFISLEKKESIRSGFRKLFDEYLLDLWKNNPNYAIAVELWLKYKLSLTKENLNEIFLILADSKEFEADEIPDNNHSIFKSMLIEIKEIRDEYGNYDKPFTNIEVNKRKSFNKQLNELFLDERKAETRLRQWHYRGITIIRTKMEPLLNNLNNM